MQELCLKEINFADADDIETFLSGLNATMLLRSEHNLNIPYREMKTDEAKNEINNGDSFFLLMDDLGQAIGGGSIRWKYRGNDEFSELKHIWIAVEMQGKGHGKTLLNMLEEMSKNHGITTVYLSVANIYAPALNLYKKNGYKKEAIFANKPNTYYFVRMVKCFNEVTLNKHRLIFLTWSWIKFNALFHKDSTPRFIHKMIYGK